MPQIPILVPLIVVGLVLGAILKSKSPKISRKKLASASLVAGLLNSIHAYLLYSLASTRSAASVTGVPTGDFLCKDLLQHQKGDSSLDRF